MKAVTVVVSLALGAALGLAGPVGAFAQSPGATLAGSGFAGMTCAEFTRMSPRHRDYLVQHANRSAPMLGLAMPMMSGRQGLGMNYPRDTGVVPGTPLSSALIISACQAASPSTTVADAYSRANSGGGTLRFHRF